MSNDNRVRPPSSTNDDEQQHRIAPAVIAAASMLAFAANDTQNDVNNTNNTEGSWKRKNLDFVDIDDFDEDEDDHESQPPPAKKAKSPSQTVDTTTVTEAVTHDQRWEAMFLKLKAFKEQHGHCRVPNRFAEDQQLGSWVSAQRRQYKIVTSGGGETAALTPERAIKLREIGFEWATTNPRNVPWDQRYLELKSFVVRYGHAEVPMRWVENTQLSNWVSKQRHQYKLMVRGRPSRLTEERVKLLDGLRFVWEASRRRLQDGGSSENESSEDGSGVLKAAVSKKKRPRIKKATIDAASNGHDDRDAIIPAIASVPPQGSHSPMNFASQQHYHPQQQPFSPCGVGPGWGRAGFDPTSQVPPAPPAFAAGPGMGFNPSFFFPPMGAMMPFPGMLMQVPGGMPYAQGQMGATMFPGGMTGGGGMHNMMMHQNVPGQPGAESVGTGAPFTEGGLPQDNEENHMLPTAVVEDGPQMSQLE